MKNDYLLSIIIPVFNGENVLNRCIESVAAEPCDKYEVIIINDGSTDNTESLCLKWIEMDSRIHYYRQANAGVSAARNRGIKESHGEYIMFLDSDDYLKKDWWNCINAVIASKKKYDIVLFDYFKEIKQRNTLIKIFDCCKETVSWRSVVEKYIYTEGINSPWAKLFNRSMIIDNNIEFPLGMKIGEDAVFLGEVLKKAKEHLYIPKPIMVYYFDNPSSAMHIVPKKLQELEAIYMKKNEIFLYYQKALDLDADKFYAKQFYDFFTLLRNFAKDSNTKKFCDICRQSKEYGYIRDLMVTMNNKKIKSLRRKVQYILYRSKLFTFLYVELLIENFMKRRNLTEKNKN